MNVLLENFAALVAKPRRSIEAQECADQLEALAIGQRDESDQQPWMPAYKDRVTAIIDSYLKIRR